MCMAQYISLFYTNIYAKWNDLYKNLVAFKLKVNPFCSQDTSQVSHHDMETKFLFVMQPYFWTTSSCFILYILTMTSQWRHNAWGLCKFHVTMEIQVEGTRVSVCPWRDIELFWQGHEMHQTLLLEVSFLCNLKFHWYSCNLPEIFKNWFTSTFESLFPISVWPFVNVILQKRKKKNIT